MVSTYSLRPVYTFLYKIINGYVTASFVQKKICDFVVQKIFLRTHAFLNPPPLYALVRIWLDPSPPPLCVRTMWMIHDGYFYAVNETTEIQHIKPSTVKVYNYLKKLDKNLERTHFKSTLESFVKNGYFVAQGEARKNQFFQLNHLKIF